MSEKVLFIGLDVDDKAFHGAVLVSNLGELIEFKCRPHVDGLSKKLKELQARFPDHKIRICYEATYIGFTLQRDLAKKGFHCDVIAPGSIPRTYGNQVKTDRVDAGKLAQYYCSGLLAIVTPPDEQTEKDRDLLRSRAFVMGQLSEVRTHIHSLLRRAGKNFKVETGSKSHWTKHHLCWIERVIADSSGCFRSNLDLLYKQMKSLNVTLAEYDAAVDELAASPRYVNQVQALTCYRGVKNLFAMVMITEIGNIKRFPHPRKLVSWMGMDIREYSSGGKQNRFGITGHGNRYLRTAFVEANQKSFRSPVSGSDVRLRRQKLPPPLVEIAERCQKRIYKKGNRLLHAGKHPNKVKVACAREMVGFVWESLNKVAA
ncbi:IS110 family transposase [Bdellovibrionota bacterium FG-2]